MVFRFFEPSVRRGPLTALLFRRLVDYRNHLLDQLAFFNLMHTFKRSERLKSRKILGRLFEEGHSFVAFPLRAVWLPLSEAECAAANYGSTRIQVAICVSRKLHRSAVVRNRIRRQIREAYRLHKHLLNEQLQRQNLRIALALVFLIREEPSFAQLVASMSKIIGHFEKISR
ncbi:MAG: ribonuclease P protein component [Saprospiraceae bacterium]|nr:ribonuclease P protein component [Saprospiraceae bacterium]MDW8483557.1 ribonuclease P protein component [Saprospiraceae bacterium]